MDNHMKKIQLDYCLTPFTKINSDERCKCKTCNFKTTGSEQKEKAL